MKKLAKRTVALMAVLMLFWAGFGVYLIKFFVSGDNWAAFPVNSHVYNDGILVAGTIVDAAGVLLASENNGRRIFSSDYTTRLSTLHVVGDTQGNIGTGLLTYYDTQLMGYNIFDGVFSLSGAGNTVYTTIDSRLCNAALKALNSRRGAVTIYNYKTGDIICMVSTPSFDPAAPPDLKSDQPDARYEGAYINRALSSTFTPGSIFKTVTLMAAIETLPDLRDLTFICSGSIEIDGDIVTCSGVHGRQNIDDAFAHSCNVAFAQLALRLGGDTLARYAKNAGLLTNFTTSGIPVAAGSFQAADPDTADLAWSGVGQYMDLVNPLAMARLMGAIANGGATVNPRLVSAVTTPIGLSLPGYGSGASHRLVSKSTAATLRDMLRYNTQSNYGDWRFPGLVVYGKTGTAEVGTDQMPHAWFTGFLDDPDHPYAFSVLIENGGSGLGQAIPLANTVLQLAVTL